MTPDERRAWVEANIGDQNPQAAFFSDLDAALVGYVQQGSEPPLACYDFDRIIAVLMERDGMDKDDAVDWFGHNTQGSWLGWERTPVVLFAVEEDEAEGGSVPVQEPPVPEPDGVPGVGVLPTMFGGQPHWPSLHSVQPGAAVDDDDGVP